ncbi:FecR family protein [Flammeovirga pacifica]|uniref:Protein FecR C-terminal domain-containing protein n=1 Tax=Flammeovirga pacifica TaxID=915059 RepID=A0A1S1Z1D4_FLAPC|nr:FecR family protein [Flammeovirga pacifica]OHX67084.1 hypothetical protein NH26_12395 [Flammeovirga pacifica]
MSPEEEKEYNDKILYDLNHPNEKKHEEELASLHNAMDQLSNMKIPTSKKTKEQSWKEIQGKLNIGESQKEKRGVIEILFNPQQFRKVAAVAAVFVGIYALWFFFNGIQNVSPSDGTLEYTFPDGSVAYIKKGSSLEYLKHGFEGNIYMNGHAQFHILPESKGGVSYEVKTDRSVVHANAGAMFDIRDDDFLFHLTNLGEDILQVSSPHHQDDQMKTTVQKGHSLKSTSKKIGNAFDLGTDHAHWTKGHFVYNEVPLTMVLYDFEKQFGVVINHEFDQIGEMLYSGSFKDEGITAAVTSLCKTLEVDFILEGEKVILRNK